MIRISLLFLLTLSFFSAAQKKIEISLEGYVNDFSSKKKLYGASIYMFQGGTMISKVLSDANGDYSIVGRINTKVPFDLMISTPGYVTKKVLFDFEDLKVQNPNGVLQAMEELVIELFEIKDGVDLNFINNTYAEKFTWEGKMAVPEEKYNKDIEDKVLLAYREISNANRVQSFKRKMNRAIQLNEFEEALRWVDSALFYRQDAEDLIQKKSQILNYIDKRSKDIERREEFEKLKKQGDAAYSKGDFEAAELFYKDAIGLFSDNQISSRLVKINDYKEKVIELEVNKDKIERLRFASDSLVEINDFDGAIAHLRDIQSLAPNEIMTIQEEISEIETDKKNYDYEQSVIGLISIANRLAKSKDSLDASLSVYSQVEKLIKKMTDPVKVSNYTVEVEEGIKNISQSKSEEREAFNQQFEKANNNFLDGPEYYDKAQKILDSDLMKPYKNEPEVKKLKNRILVMEKFYSLKNSAFDKSSINKKEAIAELKNALDLVNNDLQLVSIEDITELKDSINSWSGETDYENITNKQIQESANNRSSSIVKSPGILVDSDLSVYEDLASTIQRINEAPAKNIQRLKDEMDYEIYFNNTLNEVMNERSSKQIESYLEELEIKNREAAQQKLDLQRKQDRKRELLESSSNERKEIAILNQELSVKEIQKRMDQRDYLVQLELSEQVERDELIVDKIRSNEREQSFINQNNQIDNEQRLNSIQENISTMEYQRYVEDSLNQYGGENRAEDIERLKSFKSNNLNQPNYLKNEKGELFPSNAMTERVFKQENDMGYVTVVTVQRVVVDANGYGVVYEKTTNESGSTYFKRNGAPITEYIWFNESMGQNVIED